MNSIAEIIEALRGAGFPVLDLTGCGEKLPDLSVLVGSRAIQLKVEPIQSKSEWFSVRYAGQAVELAQAFEAAYDRLNAPEEILEAREAA